MCTNKKKDKKYESIVCLNVIIFELHYFEQDGKIPTCKVYRGQCLLYRVFLTVSLGNLIKSFR